MPKHLFELNSWLTDNGMEFVDKGPNGSVRVKDADGEIGELDVQSIVKDLGGDPANTKVQYNTPEEPMNISPLDVTDRAKLSVGNVKGSINYLSNKFGKENVKYDKENGFVVDNDGVWQRVDASGLGIKDSWETSRNLLDFAKKVGKEAVSDIVDLSDLAINVTAATKGAAEGAAIGAVAGPVGAFVGGVVGAGAGGLGAAAVRTSFGRLAGTYDSSPDEELKDIAMETVFTMGGQAIAPGVQLGVGKVVQGLSKLKNGLSHGARELITEVYGKVTGVGKDSMDRLIEAAPEVMGKVKTLVGKAGKVSGTEGAQALAKKEMINTTETILNEAVDELPRKYGQVMNQLMDAADKRGFKVSTKDLVEDSMSAIEESGLGKFERVYSQSQQNALKQYNKVASKFAEKGHSLPVPEPKSIRFVALTPEEAAGRIAQGLPAEAPLSPDAVKSIQPMIDTIISLRNVGDLEGKAAARTLTKFQTLINNVSKGAYASNDVALQRVSSIAKKGWQNGVQGAFEKAGLGPQHAELSALYGKYGDSVELARQIIKRDGAEGLTNKLISGADRNFKAKGDFSELVTLLGEKGDKMYRNMLLTDTASKFLPWAPKLNLGNVGGGAYALGALGPLKTAAVLTQASPRIVGKQAAALKGMSKYASEQLNMLRGLPPESLNKFLKDDRVINTFIRTAVMGFRGEQDGTQDLLQKTGVTGQ